MPTSEKDRIVTEQAGIWVIDEGPNDEDIGLNMRKKAPVLKFGAKPCHFSAFINAQGHAKGDQIPPWGEGRDWWWLHVAEGCMPVGRPFKTNHFIYCSGPKAADRFGIMVPDGKDPEMCRLDMARVVERLIKASGMLDSRAIVAQGYNGLLFLRESCQSMKDRNVDKPLRDDTRMIDGAMFGPAVKLDFLTWTLSLIRYNREEGLRLSNYRLPLDDSLIAPQTCAAMNELLRGLSDGDIRLAMKVAS